jgi:hypothetical protein
MLRHASRARRGAGAFLILLSVFLLGASGIVYNAQVAQAGELEIRADRHEGQFQTSPGVYGGYTTGNVTTYSENDDVNFRVTLSSDDGGLVGTMLIEYSREGSTCSFFSPVLTPGTHNAEAPPVVAISGNGSFTYELGTVTAVGSDWVQPVTITWAAGASGEAYFYYYLHIDSSVNGCTGSSQHSQLDAPATGAGAFKATGQKSVNVPANALVRIPDITIIKMINRNGDGHTYVPAAAGEYRFTLTAPGGGTTTASTDNSGEVTFADVEPAGAYTVTEQQVLFDQGTYSFASGLGADGCSFSGSTADVTVVAASTSDVPNPSCTFYNDPAPARILVDKVTDPSGSSQSFEFDPSWSASNFFLTDAAAPADSGALVPGTYSVAEVNLPSGWDLTSATCSDGSPVSAIVLGVAETVTCTFTNTQRGHILVDKVTDPSGSSQSFEFDPSWSASNFFLTDAAAPADSGALVPGTYSVAEVNLPSGWDLTSATCSDGSPVSAIVLGAGETVTCTFADTLERGHIYVDKATDPSGSAQSFEFDPSWGDNFYLTDADPAHDSGPLLPGTYSVGEVNLPAGWSQSNVTCSDGSSPSAIDLSPGEAVTCVFSNLLARGRIYVDKVTDPSGSAQSFEFEPSWGDNFFLTDAGAPNDSGALLPGTYSVDEVNLPSGWDLTSATCDDGSPISAIDLGPGEVVTCTFTNTQRGAIVVAKETLPDGSQETFHFTGAVDSWLYDGTSTGAVEVLPGTYSVTEEAKAGWDLTGISCSDTDSTGDVGTATATFNVDPGEVVTCTFTNRQEGQIIVAKETVPGGASASFGFTGDISATLGDGESSTPVSVDPGGYSVTETPQAGWDLTGISCVDSDYANSSGNVETATANFNVEPGETVTCTFTNTQRGHILVDKVTDPSGSIQPFEFGPSWGGDFFLTDADAPHDSGALPPGTYSVDEVNLPSGWDLTSATCDDGSPISAIDLGPGETVTCTFTNTQRGHILVAKETLPDGASQTFDFTGDIIATLGDGQSSAPVEVVPGAYSATELGQEGWDLTGISCSDTNSTGDLGSSTADFSVEPGETVTCTFTNTERGHIVVAKVTDPSDDPTTFDFTGDITATLGNGGSSTPVEVVPGTYSATEGSVTGWAVTDISCDDGSSASPSSGDVAGGVATFNVDPGETVTCTFSNYRLPTGALTIIKDANPSDGTLFSFNNGDFSLTDGGSHVIPDVGGQQVVVTEDVLSGDWRFSEVTCDAADWSADGQTVTVNVGRDEAASCTFTNYEMGHIIVEKQTLPDGSAAVFDFTGDITASLSDGQSSIPLAVDPGSYSVTEGALAGWNLTDISCDDGNSSGDVATGEATFNVEAGESVTCTYTNTQDGRIIVEKLTVPLAAPVLAFDFTPSWGGGFALANGESEDSGYTLTPGGSYSVSEALPAPTPTDVWVLLSAVCSDGSDPGAISLDPGETVTCTFTNLWTYIGGGATAALTIIKAPTPADNTVFSFTGDMGSFTLQAPSHPSMQFLDLDTGVYTVTESALAGWDFDHVTCTGGEWVANGSSVTVFLGEGEITSCTFYNTAEELPFTGTPTWFLALLIMGLGAMAVGTGLLLLPLGRRSGRH